MNDCSGLTRPTSLHHHHHKKRTLKHCGIYNVLTEGSHLSGRICQVASARGEREDGGLCAVARQARNFQQSLRRLHRGTTQNQLSNGMLSERLAGARWRMARRYARSSPSSFAMRRSAPSSVVMAGGLAVGDWSSETSRGSSSCRSLVSYCPSSLQST